MTEEYVKWLQSLSEAERNIQWYKLMGLIREAKLCEECASDLPCYCSNYE